MDEPPTDFRRIASRLLERAKVSQLCATTAEEVAAREAEQATARLAAELGPRYAPSRCRLETFRVYHARQQPVVDRLIRLRGRIGELAASGAGLVLYGPVGTGKDHLLAALLYAACGIGLRCRWLNGQDSYGALRDRMDSGASEEEFFGALANPDVLAISDPIPPVGEPSAWNTAALYRLLDRRYRLLRPTWCALNATSADDADAKLSSPVWDRLREAAELVPCFWPSYRRPAKESP